MCLIALACPFFSVARTHASSIQNSSPRWASRWSGVCRLTCVCVDFSHFSDWFFYDFWTGSFRLKSTFSRLAVCPFRVRIRSNGYKRAITAKRNWDLDAKGKAKQPQPKEASRLARLSQVTSQRAVPAPKKVTRHPFMCMNCGNLAASKHEKDRNVKMETSGNKEKELNPDKRRGEALSESEPAEPAEHVKHNRQAKESTKEQVATATAAVATTTATAARAARTMPRVRASVPPQRSDMHIQAAHVQRLQHTLKHRQELPRNWFQCEWIERFSVKEDATTGKRCISSSVIDDVELFDWIREFAFDKLTPTQYRSTVRRNVVSQGPGYVAAPLAPDVRRVLTARIQEMGKKNWGFQVVLANRKRALSLSMVDGSAAASSSSSSSGVARAPASSSSSSSSSSVAPKAVRSRKRKQASSSSSSSQGSRSAKKVDTPPSGELKFTANHSSERPTVTVPLSSSSSPRSGAGSTTPPSSSTTTTTTPTATSVPPATTGTRETASSAQPVVHAVATGMHANQFEQQQLQQQQQGGVPVGYHVASHYHHQQLRLHHQHEQVQHQMQFLLQHQHAQFQLQQPQTSPVWAVVNHGVAAGSPGAGVIGGNPGFPVAQQPMYFTLLQGTANQVAMPMNPRMMQHQQHMQQQQYHPQQHHQYEQQIQNIHRMQQQLALPPVMVMQGAQANAANFGNSVAPTTVVRSSSLSSASTTATSTTTTTTFPNQ